MSEHGLARRLGLFSAAVIVVSGIIGGGIFINPYLVAEKLPTAGGILAVWIAGGAIALCGAFVFAELSTVVPKVGGPYAFCREGIHPLVGFLYGWTALLVVSSSAVAAMAVALAENVVLMAGTSPSLRGPLAVGMLLLLGGYHALGVKPGAVLLNVLTTFKVIVLALLVMAALPAGGHAPVADAAPPGAMGGTLSQASRFLEALIPVMFAYGGWQNLNFIAEEVRDPLRNLPRAVLLGVTLVIVVYLGANLAYLSVLSPEGLSRSHTPASDVATAVWGPAGGRFLSAMITLSLFGYLNLALLSFPRVYYAMAADGLFFEALARVHPRFRSPVAAILLQSVLAAAMAVTAAYGNLVSLAVFGDWVFYALAGVALVRLRRLRPDAARTFPTPLYPLTPALFTLSALAILGNALYTQPRSAGLAAAVIAAGIPVYLFWSRRRGRGAPSAA